MSGRKSKEARKANGTDLAKRGRKQPTPLLERSYIQAPVGLNPDGTLRYRSGGQVRNYLKRWGVDVEALKGELEQWMAAQVAAEEASKA